MEWRDGGMEGGSGMEGWRERVDEGMERGSGWSVDRMKGLRRVDGVEWGE